MNEFIANTKEEYISIALNSISSIGIKNLKKLRKDLRSKMKFLNSEKLVDKEKN